MAGLSPGIMRAAVPPGVGYVVSVSQWIGRREQAPALRRAEEKTAALVSAAGLVPRPTARRVILSEA